ncbi:MAG TPA: VWA domain-containing protein, partial [Enhygromyxa sp.]|nr:VWA domain-containing protein [Enhygromyxa sp.]
MRIATVGVLATLGMILTSTAVWSATAPSDDASQRADASSSDDPNDQSDPPKTDDGDRKDPKADDGKPRVDKSTFVAGKTLMMEGRLGHAKMLADARGETFLYVDVRSEIDVLDKLGNRGFEPLNLAVVIDHSGSMKGQRERNALDAAAGMIRRLRDGDTVSVVAYSDQAQIIVPVTTVSSTTRERIIIDMQDGMAGKPSGHTCISCGVELGMRTLSGRRAGIDRMLLLSDGEANRGVQDEAGIRTIARQARNRGATISSIGVDVDYNERILAAIARESNGRHYFVENAASLSKIFAEEQTALKTTLAKDTELVVDLAPGVRVENVFDRSFRQEGNKLFVPFGTISANEQKTLLIRLSVPR